MTHEQAVYESDRKMQIDFRTGSENLLTALWNEHPRIIRRLTGKPHA